MPMGGEMFMIDPSGPQPMIVVFRWIFFAAQLKLAAVPEPKGAA